MECWWKGFRVFIVSGEFGKHVDVFKSEYKYEVLHERMLSDHSRFKICFG